MMTTPNQVAIKNLETNELWNFEAESSNVLDPEQSVHCCLHKAIGAGGHSPTCCVVAKANQEAAAAWAKTYNERRERSREMCGKGGCTLPVPHNGSHRGSCGCFAGCQAHECPNV